MTDKYENVFEKFSKELTKQELRILKNYALPEENFNKIFKKVSFDELCQIVDKYEQNGYDDFYLEINNNSYPNEDDGIMNAEIKLSGTKIYTEQEIYNYYKQFIPFIKKTIHQQKEKERESRKRREQRDKEEYERLKKKFCK